ncbi:MAG: hypothetical protein EKK48_12140 [Candidatus Melainabacteria bacterium]|nr:MAG: hypothetical protein EKK48_12140 [Candidatus Melainabacteria bacterium]
MSKTAPEAAKILNATKVGDSYIAVCPVCFNGTLGFGDEAGELSFTCKNKCAGPKIHEGLQRLGVFDKPKPQRKASKKKDAGLKWWTDGKLAGEWTYRDFDAEGNIVETLKVKRYDMPDGTIQYPSSRPPYGMNDGGTEGWKPVLFDYPEIKGWIAENCSVFLTTSEEAARRLQDEGFAATTHKGGSKSQWRVEYSEQLAGAKQIVILTDGDKAGIEHAEAKAKALKNNDFLVKVIRLNPLEWLGDKHTADELIDLIEATEYFVPAPPEVQEQPSTFMPGVQNPFTELATAERFANDFRDVLIYAGGLWWIWNGKKWEEDEKHKAVLLVGESVRKWYKIFSTDGNIDRQELKNWHKALESLGGLKHVLELSRPLLIRDFEIFDNDPLLLNLRNGTYSFEQKKLLPHKKEDYCSKIIDIDYNPKAVCITFLDGLNKTFAGNRTIIEFVLRAIGYSLTGLTDEQVFFFCYGPQGQNGKSTLLELVQKIMGEYARGMSKKLILEGGQDTKFGNPWRIAGRRYILLDEIDETDRVSETALKQVTGEDTVSASKMFKDATEFMSVSKLWMRGNEKPRVKASDSVFRRVVLIPFMVRMEKVPRIKSRLWAEREGILNLFIAAAEDYMNSGLRIPPEIDEATNEYRKEMDIFKDFLSECFELEIPEIPKEHSLMFVRRADMFRVLTQWQKECGHARTWDIHRMQREMKARGYEIRKRDGHPCYRGLKLTPEWTPNERVRFRA